jgi:hypothetical protein
MPPNRIVAFHPALPARCDSPCRRLTGTDMGYEKECHALNLNLDHAKERKP